MNIDNPYQIGDPVVDLAQGRPMVVLDAPDESVADWSERNSYELTENYANGKLGADDEQPVVECVYVSDVRSEPSKTYTFPASRVVLLDAHHADDGRRIYQRVVVSLLEQLFRAASGAMEPDNKDTIAQVARDAGVEPDALDEARELAEVEQTIAQDDA